MPRSFDELVTELNNRRDGVSATLDPPSRAGGDWSLLLYGSTWVARLFPTNSGSGYTLASLGPVRIRDHDRLARGCLFLRTPGWRLGMTIRHIPREAHSQWSKIGAEWQALQESLAAQDGKPPVTPAQSEFLDRVGHMIDAEEKIVTEQARKERPYPYRDVRATGESRHGAHPIYEFLLTGDRPLAEGTFVQIRGEAEQRGQVTFTRERWVTVRFDQRVDWERIEQTGDLEVTPSTIVYDKQREAIGSLRNRKAANTSLLAAVVDRRVRPIRPRTDQPTVDLDEDQQAAFGKALAVEDLLLVLGPPGTGKTRVISQIAEATALGEREQRRVLVTSHTNRAVDNVLERLPAGLLVIRVGNEGAVTTEGRPYLLERQVTELRQQVLNAIGPRLEPYRDLGVARTWAAELDDRAETLRAAAEVEARADQEYRDARRAVGGPAQRKVDELERRRRGHARRLARSERRVDRLVERHAAAAARTGRAVVGALFAALADRYTRRLVTARATCEDRRAAEQRCGEEVVAAEQELDAATMEVPQVGAARAARAEAARAREESQQDTLRAAHATRAVLRPLAVPPEVRDTDAAVLRDDLDALRGWLAGRLPVLDARATLLAQWHQEVAVATDQLRTELVRYADVIAATCIGAASRSELSGLDFDLAVVDEAGQIGIANLLVPLARARRGVLVGDHQQLPPFLDSDVAEWGRGVDDPAVRELLAKSGFELLSDRLPAANLVALYQQRRMPAMVAEFISHAFYGGNLTTRVLREHHDPIFRAPMAFVDTARLPEQERYEKPSGRLENWGRKGCFNPTEAALLAGLAAFYHRRNTEWAVIVPYRAQVEAIVRLLADLVPDAAAVKLNVGTVDSFQGGERDVILFGFTRSNAGGNVGFLRELRRANVAITRVKQQLVLVGDMRTLIRAQDDPFRVLAVSLRDHIAAHGDVRQYREIEARIASR